MTAPLEHSERIPLRGLDDVERDGKGKKVVAAWLRLEKRYGPTPARRVVSIKTRDGAVYRFQRYDSDERLAFYDRTNADGSRVHHATQLPQHVEAVRNAVMDGDVLPEFESFNRATQQVGVTAWAGSTDNHGDAREARLADGTKSREHQIRTDGGGAAFEGGEVPNLETLEVAHFARSSKTNDLYGGRKRRGGDLAHAANTNPPQPGWLGNPFLMNDDADQVTERRRVIAAWTRYFLERVETDQQFREAVRRLRGKRVACWCRGVSQERTAETWCHLDVVAAWLSGDLTPVYGYLRGGNT